MPPPPRRSVLSVAGRTVKIEFTVPLSHHDGSAQEQPDAADQVLVFIPPRERLQHRRIAPGDQKEWPRILGSIRGKGDRSRILEREHVPVAWVGHAER